jgi:sugar (pentulose or hexulose) kinase
MEAAGRAVPAELLICLPWLGGARAPWWADGATAGFVGLTSVTTAADLARAAVEGVALDIARCINALAPDAAGIVLAGGGAAARAWTGIVTAMTGLRGSLRATVEAASAGAAVVTASALGLDLGTDDVNPEVGTVEPDPELVATYAARRERADEAAAQLLALSSGSDRGAARPDP